MRWIGANSYVFGFVVGFIVYTLLMKNEKGSYLSEEEFDKITNKSHVTESEAVLESN
jgi:hypothetical protein